LEVKADTDKSQALVLAHEGSRYTNILQSTKAIVFFGTPHLGSEHADFLSILIGIVNTMESISMVQHTFGKTRQDLVDILKPRSTELENLSMSFTNRTKDIEIVSFYEEKAMSPFKREVSCSSAVIPPSLKECLDTKANTMPNYRISDCPTQLYQNWRSK
jgi:hypothetical protein